MRLRFKHIHEKAFSSHYILQEHFLKQSSGLFALFFFLVGNLNWFEKVAVSIVHLVPVAQYHDPFHRSKNRTVRHTFFSRNILILELRILHIKHLICMSKLQIRNLKAMIFSVLIQIQQPCAVSGSRILASIFEIKFLPVHLIFNFKLLLPYWWILNFLTGASNVHCLRNIYY